MPRHKLTDAFLRNVKPPATGQIEYWDRLIPSFGVRVSYGGRKAFQVLTRVNGKLRRFSLGGYPRFSLADARDRAEQVLRDAAKGISPKDRDAEEQRAAQAERLNSFRAVTVEFMEDHAKNLRTRDEMQRMIKTDLLPAWGERPISSITRADIKALLREKASTGPIAANRLLALISKIFTWALDEEIIGASPAVRLKRPSEEHERERSLSTEEIKTLWPAFTAIGYPFGHAMKFLLVTGQRRGEVSGMKWCEIDGEGWTLPGSRSKSKQGHRVPLSSLALDVLRESPHVGEYVFTARGGPLEGWDFAKQRLAAPIAPWRIHDLRRTFATHLRSLGVDRLVVSKLLNHAEAGVTRIYDRYALDAERTAAMEKWAQRLREII